MTLLELDDIHTYYGQSHVLDGISLSVDAGESVALLGRNGAGKTTTLRSIIGVSAHRSGEVRLHGEPTDTAHVFRNSRRGIGYVPEDREVFGAISVRDNIAIAMKSGSDWTMERIYETFPVLEEKATAAGDELSGGEQQMLSIARALVTDPDLLLLDEPTKGLAPVIVEDLTETLEDIIESGIAVLLAEQNTNFAFELADRGYILDKGRIVWDGRIEQLQSEEELLDRYLSV